MFFKPDLTKKPVVSVFNTPAWKTLPIEECGEPLVPIGPFSEHQNIFQDAIYFGEGPNSPYKRGELNGALLTPFMRQGVANRLEEASKLLPEGCAFLIWDAYRPLSVQGALFDDYRDFLINKKGLSKDQADIDAQTMVSIPSNDPSKPSPHNTGGSVDLTIIRFTKQDWAEMKKLNKKLQSPDWQTVYGAEQARWALLRKAVPLDMGGKFDEVTPDETIADTKTNRTETRYYELKEAAGVLSVKEEEILSNRRLLVNSLESVGLSNYAPEWWHFDFGNQFYAQRTGKPAIYGAAAFTEECQNHEDVRVGNFVRNETLAINPMLATRLSDPGPSRDHWRFVAIEAMLLQLPIKIGPDKAQRLTS